MDLFTASTSFKEHNNSNMDSLNSTTSTAAAAAFSSPMTSTPRQRPRRVKMPSDLSGMFCPHEGMGGSTTPFSTPPSVASIINLSASRRSTMSMMMPLAPSLSISERSVPPESRDDIKSAPTATEDQGMMMGTASRKLRRIKRQLLLDSVVKSTSDQMAVFHRDRSLSNTSSSSSSDDHSDIGGNGMSMYS